MAECGDECRSGLEHANRQERWSDCPQQSKAAMNSVDIV
mgnify:CR=1 FL=1